MSTSARMISGSIASWCRVAVGVIAQVCFVPVYLSHWTPRMYGAWLALQSAMTAIQILDNGHSRFLANEFLRIGQRRLAVLRRTFWSAIAVAIVFGAVQTLVVSAACYGGSEIFLQDHGAEFGELATDCAVVLVTWAFVWWILGSVGGIAVIAASPFGHYSKMAWWGVASASVTSLAPALVAWRGGSLMQAGLAMIAVTVLVNIPMLLDLARLLRQAGLYPVRPSRRIAVRNLLLSQVVTLQNLLEMLRQQGVRIILAPMAGVAAVAGFATMRTGANVALQGLQTVTNPLLPELMRFVSQREEEKTQSALATVWVVLGCALAPAAILLQLFVEPAFALWTRGKIEFDPMLFALLTITVLVFALAQPAMAVVNGNNLLRIQLGISIAAGATMLGLMLLLVPQAGLHGAGVALVAGEVVSAVGFVLAARRWLADRELAWPRTLFRWSCASIVASSVGVMAIAAAPTLKYGSLLAGLVASAIIAAGLWRSVPAIARLHMHQLSGRLKFWRRPAAAPVGE